MTRSSHAIAVERAVGIGGRHCSPTLQADRRMPGATGVEPGQLNFMQGGALAARETHNLEVGGSIPPPATNFRALASICISNHPKQTALRRRTASVGARIECVATPTVFFPVDRSDTGPAVFPHRSSSRRPTSFGRVRSTPRGRFFYVNRASLSAFLGNALLVVGGIATGATVITHARIYLHRNEPGSHATQDDAESLGSVASIIGLLRHEWDHDQGGLHEGAKDLQGCADGYC
jgi:hypothetical protein